MGQYSVAFTMRHTAGLNADSTVFSMRNDSGSTIRCSIKEINLSLFFNAASPLLNRSTLCYELKRFTTATPSGGSEIEIAKIDNDSPNSQVSDVRFLVTGLTMTNVSVESGTLAIVSCSSVDGAEGVYDKDIGIILAPGEGLCVRTKTAAVAGQELSGEIVWKELKL